MEEMFNNSRIYNINFKVYVPNLKTTVGMFNNCGILINCKLEGILENVNSSRIETLENMFSYTNRLQNFSIENVNFLELTNMKNILFNANFLRNIIP